MTDDLEALIADLETAPDGNVDLSERVARAIGWEFFNDPLFDFWRAPDESEHEDPPSFTEDVGAAWSLAPVEAGVTLHRFLGLKGRSWATIHTNYQKGTVRPAGTLARPEWTCAANSEALALCAAAIRFRLESENSLHLINPVDSRATTG